MTKKEFVRDKNISNDEIIEIFDKFNSMYYRTLIDIFPEQVKSPSKYY